MMLILITNIITFSDIYDNRPLIGFNVPTTVLIFITQLKLVNKFCNLNSIKLADNSLTFQAEEDLNISHT